MFGPRWLLRAASIRVLHPARLLKLFSSRAHCSAHPCSPGRLFRAIYSLRPAAIFRMDLARSFPLTIFIVDPSLNYPQAMQCAVTFFCLNTSTACGCSDASQPMFSFDVPLQYSAVDDLQAGLQSGDVVQRISRGARSLSSRLHRRPSCRAARTTRQRLRPRSMPRTRLKGACVQ